MTQKVLVTGGTGFVGAALITRLLGSDICVVAPARKALPVSSAKLETPMITDITTLSQQTDLFADCDVVVHVAAKAHAVGVPLEQFRLINTQATVQLAQAAAAAGVKRFIFLSSIGVNGIATTRPFTAADIPAPVEDYARSKLEAELALQQLAAKTAMQLVIIRPPLVYGPDAPGNFGKLAKLAQKNLPLPLGAVQNKRSLIALDNLIDVIVTCIDHPAAANQTFLVSDDDDISTTQLLELITRAAGKTPRLLPVPVSWLRLAAKLTGKQAIIDRLCGNLQLDISHTRQTLGWTPPVSVQQGITRCFINEEVC